MNLDYFLQLFVQGIIIGCVYATAALGFVLITNRLGSSTSRTGI